MPIIAESGGLSGRTDPLSAEEHWPKYVYMSSRDAYMYMRFHGVFRFWGYCVCVCWCVFACILCTYVSRRKQTLGRLALGPCLPIRKRSPGKRRSASCSSSLFLCRGVGALLGVRRAGEVIGRGRDVRHFLSLMWVFTIVHGTSKKGGKNKAKKEI